MSVQKRWLLALAVVLLDLVAVVVPLAALFIAYVLIERPPEIARWIQNLYRE